MPPPAATSPKNRRKRGFERTSGLLQGRIRQAGEGRGFAVTRLLTHWAEVAGADIAAATRPVNISYGRGGLGATLTLLTTGAQAPMVEMASEKLKERVNACYGYAAISRIRITQTAPQGFADGKFSFDHAPATAAAPAPDPRLQAEAQAVAKGVSDDTLRAALEALGTNVLTRSTRSKKVPS